MELTGCLVEEELLEVPNGDPSSYCRLCLSERRDELEELFPVGQGPRLETIDRIAQCTGIQISQDEDFPSAVCWMCSMSLEEFQWFRERCRRHDVLIRRKRKELVQESGYEVSIMDDPDETVNGGGPPMLQIASVQERFDGGRGSSHSLLEPTSYQPPEDEEYEGDDFDGEEEEDGEEPEDVKPDHEMLDAYAQQFRKTNGEVELRSESVMTGTTTAEYANENPFKCADCGKRFAEQAELDQHSKLHPSAGELPFSCKDCGTSFHRSKTLRKHREKYHSKDSVEDPPLRLKCEFCPRVFPRHADRKGHEVRVHKELYRPGKTPPPTKRKSLPVEKPTPVQTPAPTPTLTPTGQHFTCSLCVTPVNFPKSTDLEEHIEKLHTNSEGVLICLMCPKTFKHRTTLKMHVLNHQGKLPHECKDCGSRFDRMIYLTRHRQRYHNGTNSPAILPQLRCKFCPRTFLRAMDRTTHMRLVHIKTSASSSIKREKLTPDPTKQEATSTPPPSRPELSFGCLQCGKDFPSPAMLREHTEDQHTKKPPPNFYEVKPIIIKTEPGLEEEEAEKQTPQPVPKPPPKPPVPAKNLPFKCPRCPRRFANGFAAREHTRIHTGKLRFRCEICSAMFHRTNFLRRHMERFHGQDAAQRTVMQCKLCGRGFFRKQDIKKHEKIAHGMHGYGGVDEGMDVEEEEEGDGENGFEEENGEEYEEVSPEDVEIRDVVVTLERIPDDVLETVDVSYGDDDDEEDEEDTDEVSSKKVVPRMNITLHRCPHCLRVFKSRALLVKHMVYHQSVLPFPCDECGVQFARKHLLQAHKERYHSEDAPMIGERFSCNYCSRIFLRDRDRISHVRNVHVMERTYGTREEEGTPELKKSKLKKKRKDYICLLCNDRFESERSCQRHINQAHPAEAQPPAAKTPSESPAPIEPKVEITEPIEPKVELNESVEPKAELSESVDPKADLSESVEPKEEPVESTESPSEDLKPSISTSPVSAAAAPTPQATRLKPYKLCRCAICTAIFKNEDHWKAHVNEHPKHCRPHHCEPCLIKRKAGRSNKKVTTVGFKCQYCAKVFKRKGTLRNHLRLHNSELRFPCDECGMKYDRFRLLQAHKEKYHSEDAAQQPPLETFRCDLCERMFLRMRDLNHHREKVHGIEGC